MLSVTYDRIRLSPFLIAEHFNYLVWGNATRKIGSLFYFVFVWLQLFLRFACRFAVAKWNLCLQKFLDKMHAHEWITGILNHAYFIVIILFIVFSHFYLKWTNEMKFVFTDCVRLVITIFFRVIKKHCCILMKCKRNNMM